MGKRPHLPDELDALIRLAKRLAGRRRYGEAAELFRMALRLDPENLGAKLALAEVRKRMGQMRGRPPRGLRDDAEEQHWRDSIDAGHFLGLAHLYAEKGEHARALECLEVAQDKLPASASVWKLEGHILARRREYETASESLARALRFNPFDREIAESLGRAAYESRNYEEALRYTVHAFLLLNDADREGESRLRRRIRTLKQILGWGNRELGRVFHERQESLHVAFDRLEWHRERFVEESSFPQEGFAKPSSEPPGRVGQIELAARLRRLTLWSHLSDEQLFRLTKAVREESHESGSELFDHGSAGRDLYVLESGEVEIQRTTPYGKYRLATLGAGQLFGEVNFVSGGERSGKAVISKPSELLVLGADDLERMSAEDPDFGVQLYWTLWHSLAGKLRSTNELLRGFFSPEAQTENFLQLRRRHGTPDALVNQVKVDSSDKIRLFREQGLSRKELMTLATFSKEKRFPAGSSIFQEGDEGTEMYIVLEGRAMISKYIPGAGEEALAILERGDFFGEMALIDGTPRSADAQAHGAPLTVLALDEATVQEILSMDAAASLEFLQLLCRLVTHRLREIDEKVIGWRILSGERDETASA